MIWKRGNGREETARRAALRAARRNRAKKIFEPAFHPQAPAYKNPAQDRCAKIRENFLKIRILSL